MLFPCSVVIVVIGSSSQSIAARQSRAIRCRSPMRDKHRGPGTSQGCRAFSASAVRASGAATCTRSGGSIPPGLRALQVLGCAVPLCRVRGPVTAPSGLRVGARFRDRGSLSCRRGHSGMARLSRAAIPSVAGRLRKRRLCVQGRTAPAGNPAAQSNAYYAINVKWKRLRRCRRHEPGPAGSARQGRSQAPAPCAVPLRRSPAPAFRDA